MTPNQLTKRTSLWRVFALISCLASGLWPFISLAEDQVTIRTATGAGQVIVRGEVMEWSSERLRMKAGGDVREFDAANVTNVESPRLEKHLAGLKALETGKPDEAHSLLTESLAEESRLWMRREILAAIIRADLARVDRASAGKDFLALLESDPNTRHFKILPLDWQTTPPDANLAGAARGWLSHSDSDIAKLLASSVLLFDPLAGEKAAETLDRLARSSDRRIYTLARAQLWRKQVAAGEVPAGEVERWEDRVKEIPESLRGGAYFQIGRAWARRGDPERAAAAFLWLPLVYDFDGGLAAAGAVSAADELATIGRTADAVQLYREVLSRFPETTAAARAREQLERWTVADKDHSEETGDRAKRGMGDGVSQGGDDEARSKE